MKKTIIFSGGGTLGSVSPLLAVYTRMKRRYPDAKFFWVGTYNGQEQEFVKQYGIHYVPISAGKLRRYFSLRNVSDFFLSVLGFFQSILVIIRLKPDLLISAGGYVSVPLHIAGWVLRRQAVILQQDVEIGLANKLMAPFARRIFVSLPEALNYFSKTKSVVVGNPAREEIFIHTKEEGVKKLGLDPAIPTVLIFGGGTGAAVINRLVEKAVGQLVQFCQVIHITGKGKTGNTTELAKKYARYHPYTFIREAMAYALSAADVVVSRAGFASLAEFSSLGKPAIIIPIPDSHQERNVEFFEARKAIEVLQERKLSSDSFANAIKDLILDEKRRKALGEHINAVFIDTTGERLLEELENLLT